MSPSLAVLLAAAQLSAAETSAPPPLVVRLGVGLVQVDVVVTDRHGRAVTDLTAADFEVRQDGKRQAVSHAAYMGLVAAATAPGPAPAAADALGGAPPAPAEASDAVVFIVDDVALSVESVTATTRALLGFADAMEADARVFLLRTTQRVVQLTPVAGPASLRATANALRARPAPRGIDLLSEPVVADQPFLDPLAGTTNAYLNRLLARKSLLSLQDIVDALRAWRGRKTVVLFSEGYPMWDPRYDQVPLPLDAVYGHGDEVLTAVERLTDLANRASVVIHTVDPRGLVPGGLSASDSMPNPTPEQAATVVRQRQLALDTSQASLAYLADRTGGLAVMNDNHVSAGVARIVAGSRSYYLLGYEPERATFAGERPRFHKLEVRVKRPGLKVRSRKGFFGVSDEAIAALAPPRGF
jgi:VWFA-related protein